ncbi:MAG: alanine/glycine:cation symporter family protein [Synechocystis sp.]|nr:alanine/glycine:cation symporter family protein [Synechocystis sp.]
MGDITAALNHSLDILDRVFSQGVQLLEAVLFVPIAGFPVIILWLVGGALFFTVRMGGINIRGIPPAIALLFEGQPPSDPETPDQDGEVSPFQALTTALSGSIGLGNIAGVAIAIQVGGPGTVFWMTVAALLGMASKFVECALGVKYRDVRPDGTVRGGPMYTLTAGLGAMGKPRLGKGLGMLYCGFNLGGVIGGCGMFQTNQSFAILANIFPELLNFDWLYGLGFALLSGLVIVGGISRIGTVTSRLLPAMIAIYLLMAVWVIAVQFRTLPQCVTLIMSEAFSPQAVEGGAIAVFIQGIRRSTFSNHAGLGTAAMVHAVAKTDNPIKEGLVAILEPFVDTVIVCNLTALVILSTGFYGQRLGPDLDGSALMGNAFGSVVGWFPYLLAVIIFLFAFSTVISCSYYGTVSWGFLFGDRSVVVFKAIFLAGLFLGATINLGAVVDFSDVMLMGMAWPNLFGNFWLSHQVAADLNSFWQQYNRGKLSAIAGD